MRTIGVIAFGMCAAVLAACGSEAPNEDTSQAAAAQSAPCDDAGAPATTEDAGSAFFACSATADCVAVPLVQACCYNGEKIAVNAREADAYQATTACSPEQRVRAICPMFFEDDKRVPVCNMATSQCEMVPGPDAGGSASDDGGIIQPPLPNPIVF